MTSDDFHSILVGVDGSPQSLDALRWAAAQAELTGSGIVALTSWHVRLPGVPVPVDEAEPAARAMLDAAIETTLGAQRSVQVEPVLSPRGPADALLEAAERADLVVVGPHGGRLAGLQLGSVTERVITYAERPVVVVRPAEATSARIVVGLDGSRPSRAALHWATREAHLTRSSVEAIVAWEWVAQYAVYPYGPTDAELEGAAKSLLDAELAELGEAGRGIVTGRVEHGHPAGVLTDAARGARLLVVGSRGAGAGFRRLLGSTGLKCVRHADVPVVVVHGAEES